MTLTACAVSADGGVGALARAVKVQSQRQALTGNDFSCLIGRITGADAMVQADREPPDNDGEQPSAPQHPKKRCQLSLCKGHPAGSDPKLTAEAAAAG